MKKWLLLSLALLSVPIWADVDAAALARGAAILQPFRNDLQQALKTGMAENPVTAIDYCQVLAPGLATDLSHDGVRVGRSSDRLRNPRNAAEPWMQMQLEYYRTHPDDRSPRTVALPDGRTGYAEPIWVQPMCLACHGEVLAPAVAERIRSQYPQDRATGYRAGELRGIFWVEF